MVKYARNYEIEQTVMFYFDGPRSNVGIVNGKIEKVECPPDSKCCIRASRRKSVPEDFVLCVKEIHHQRVMLLFVGFLHSGKKKTSEEWLAWGLSSPYGELFGQLNLMLLWNMFAPVGATCFEFPIDGHRVAGLMVSSIYCEEALFGLLV